MRNRDFTTWLSDFRDSIADYKYYIEKVKKYSQNRQNRVNHTLDKENRCC